MKKILLFIAINSCIKSYAVVDFGATWVSNHSYGPSCLGKEYVEVGFFTDFEINNSTFQIQRSKDPGFSWAITGTAHFNGNFSGCGTCGTRQYTVNDYGPFAPNEVWYYRVKTTSNTMNFSYKYLGTYTTNLPTIVNWISQVTSQVTTGSSSSTESSYQWAQESREIQGVTISLMPTEISKIYLEQNNHKLNFSVQPNTPFFSLDANIDNGGYFNLFNGSGTTSYIWHNATSYLTNIGNYNLKVRFTSLSGTQYIREYDIYVVPKSDALFVDNYCNTMRVWKGNDPVGGIPLVFSEGFDAYNTKSEQYYRKAGNDLINCLLNKGFDVYVVNYNLNSQSIKNNGAVFQSAIRFVSSSNSNKKVIATGMSMGGLINRYACSKAENDGNPLPLSKFLTIDAPHQGAVISESFQDWRKLKLDEGTQNGYPDPFSELASNNDAAKELLNYNAYDPSGTVHNNFFSYLNSLNGDGYPHLVEKVGVSFSTSNPNPNSGLWLFVHVQNAPNPGGIHNKSVYLSSEELVAGSYLPQISVDPMPAFSPKFWSSFALALLRPMSNPWVTITQSKDPAFIPYNSSLDIINGVSKFDITIQPAITGYHDVIPPDLIEPILNALINTDLYLQNKTITDTKNYIAGNKIEAGNNVTPALPLGNFILAGGSNVTMKAGNQIILSAGFASESGSNLVAEISQVHCDGIPATQQRGMVRIEENENTAGQRTLAIYNNDIINYTYYDIKSQDTNTEITGTKGNINISPNPNNGTFLITIAKNDPTVSVKEIKIFDMMGKEIWSAGVSSTNTFNVDISSYSQGIYYVRTVNELDEIEMKKLIKQ